MFYKRHDRRLTEARPASWARRLRVGAGAVILAVGVITPATMAAGASAGTARPAAVPAPPAGFTTTWSDDFTGASGSGLNTGTWKYDTGSGQQLRHR